LARYIPCLARYLFFILRVIKFSYTDIPKNIEKIDSLAPEKRDMETLSVKRVFEANQKFFGC